MIIIRLSKITIYLKTKCDELHLLFQSKPIDSMASRVDLSRKISDSPEQNCRHLIIDFLNINWSTSPEAPFILPESYCNSIKIFIDRVPKCFSSFPPTFFFSILKNTKVKSKLFSYFIKTLSYLRSTFWQYFVVTCLLCRNVQIYFEKN